jgi:methionine synthase II (cobalamin-independent)
VVAPSCSLLHVPLDVDLEADLDPRIARWFAFARQKVTESVTFAAVCATALAPSRRSWTPETRSELLDRRPNHQRPHRAEFGDILQAIVDLDTDVISREAARSHMGITANSRLPDIRRRSAQGVYDIHSPRVPSATDRLSCCERPWSSCRPSASG